MKRMKRMKCMKSAAPPKNAGNTGNPATGPGFHETTAGRRTKRMKFMKSAGRQTHETHEIHEIREIRMHTKIQQERLCTHFMKTKSTHILQFEAFLANLISPIYVPHPIDDDGPTNLSTHLKRHLPVL